MNKTIYTYLDVCTSVTLGFVCLVFFFKKSGKILILGSVSSCFCVTPMKISYWALMGFSPFFFCLHSFRVKHYFFVT